MKKGHIKIFDTTLRDGEQSPGASMTCDQKIEMAIALERMGVDRIEAGFPVSSPVQFNAVKRIGKAIKYSKVVALARCKKVDIDASYEALKECNNRMLHVFLATSPLHREFKLKKTKDEILQDIRENIEYGKKFFSDIEFSAEDASRTEPEFLVEAVKVAINAGANTINIPDTVGYAIPEEFGKLIHRIKKDTPEFDKKNVDLSIHCHNDLGLAVANSLTAVQNGATQVEVTMNGIGERAGNCSLEELVMTLQVRKKDLGLETAIKTPLLYSTSKLLQNITGLIIAHNKPIFGDNVFSHESGIHQDGMIKNRETYEIMKPANIGRPAETLVMGRHSGKHSFKEKLKEYNITLSENQFSMAFEKFTQIADAKKEVYDEDIFSIVASVLGKFQEGYHLDYFHIYSGNFHIPTATVKVKKDNQSFLAAETGDGPVDAVFKCIDSAIQIGPKLKDFQVHAIGSGKDAQGQVKLTLTIDKEDYVGKGSSTDIIEASALAYLNAVNRHHFRNGAQMPINKHKKEN